MYAFINGINEGVEVEEAAAMTTSLPWNLTAKGRSIFCRLRSFPKVHHHELPFVNRPLSIDRMIGGETKRTESKLIICFRRRFFCVRQSADTTRSARKMIKWTTPSHDPWSRFTYLGRLRLISISRITTASRSARAWHTHLRCAFPAMPRRRSNSQRHRCDLSLSTAWAAWFIRV